MDQHFIIPDHVTEGYFGSFNGERTLTIEAPEGFSCAVLNVMGPRGGKKDSFRVTPEWLRAAGAAMLQAAENLRDDDDV